MPGLKEKSTGTNLVVQCSRLPPQGAQIPSLIQQLRSHTPKKKKEREKSAATAQSSLLNLCRIVECLRWKGSCVYVLSCIVMSDSVTPWTIACQALLSMGFSRQEYWRGLPFPSPGDLPQPGIEPQSSALLADSLSSEPPGKPKVSLDKCKWKQNYILTSLAVLPKLQNFLFPDLCLEGQTVAH